MRLSLSSFLGLSLLLLSCQGRQNESTTKDHAIGNDTAGTAIGRLTDGDRVSAYLKTNGSYYRLECPSLLGLEQLIKSFGYPMEKVKDNPSYSYDALSVLPGARLDIVLSCDLAQDPSARLVKLIEPQKYFISIDQGGKSKFNLRMLGCSSVISAMGFDLGKALPVDPKDYPIFDASDALDINCYANTQDSKAGVPYVMTPDKAQLYRIRDTGETVTQLALFNGTKAFKLDCANDDDGSKRLGSFGFDPNLAWLTPIIASDSAKAVEAKLNQQPVLRCNDTTAELKWINWPTGEKYYLFFGEVKDKAILYEVGCQDLIYYVNPNLFTTVTEIAPQTAEAFYSYAAENKLECLKGRPL